MYQVQCATMALIARSPLFTAVPPMKRCAMTLTRASLGEKVFLSTWRPLPSKISPSSCHQKISSYPRTLHIQQRAGLLQTTTCTSGLYGVNFQTRRVMYSNDSTPPKKSYTERIKVIVREYGVVAVVFHTAISLFSFGTCYFLVSR